MSRPKDYGYAAERDDSNIAPPSRRKLVISDTYESSKRGVRAVFMIFLLFVLILLVGTWDNPMLNTLPGTLREWAGVIGIVGSIASGVLLFFGLCSLASDDDKYTYE